MARDSLSEEIRELRPEGWQGAGRSRPHADGRAGADAEGRLAWPECRGRGGRHGVTLETPCHPELCRLGLQGRL